MRKDVSSRIDKETKERMKKRFKKCITFSQKFARNLKSTLEIY